MSFQEELYSTDENTENEFENVIKNVSLKKNKYITNFTFGDDYCVVKFENNIFFQNNYFLFEGSK